MSVRPSPVEATVRELRDGDLDAVVRLDTAHTGEAKPHYWRSVFRDFFNRDHRHPRVGFAAEQDGRLVGYLLGEVRAFEFGSEACGWIFSVGVETGHLRRQIASRLLAAAVRTFNETGITRIRTMVLRDNIPVLSFFRSNGFVGGSFVQLELELDPEEER
jgi:ribosomal protein S18 acetylase RimI-like enzyme